MSEPVKILIVEDEILTAMDISRNLSARGYSVMKPEARGDRAVSAALAEKPDIIIMDINLRNEMDGIRAAEDILAVYKPRIIFMTGYDDAEFKKEADRIGHDGYYIKPIEVADVLEIIKNLELN